MEHVSRRKIIQRLIIRVKYLVNRGSFLFSLCHYKLKLAKIMLKKLNRTGLEMFLKLTTLQTVPPPLPHA